MLTTMVTIMQERVGLTPVRIERDELRQTLRQQSDQAAASDKKLRRSPIRRASY
jgi:hypothetical protein